MMQCVEPDWKPHRYAAAIAAWAHGQRIEYRYLSPESTEADWRLYEDSPNSGRPNWDNTSLEWRAVQTPPVALAAHDAEPGAAPVEPTVEQHQLELVALREQVDHLRANLRVMTDAFEDLLESGQPPKGRSLDDKQAAQAWLEDAHAHIAAARRAFERPEEAPQQGQRGAGGYNS
jgi:hypothetical protein